MAYIIGFIVTMFFSILSNVMQSRGGKERNEIPFAIIFLTKICLPLQGIANVAIYSCPFVVSYKNRNPECSWIRAFVEVVKKGGDDSDNDFDRRSVSSSGNSIPISQQRRQSLSPSTRKTSKVTPPMDRRRLSLPNVLHHPSASDAIGHTMEPRRLSYFDMKNCITTTTDDNMKLVQDEEENSTKLSMTSINLKMKDECMKQEQREEKEWKDHGEESVVDPQFPCSLPALFFDDEDHLEDDDSSHLYDESNQSNEQTKKNAILTSYKVINEQRDEVVEEGGDFDDNAQGGDEESCLRTMLL